VLAPSEENREQGCKDVKQIDEREMTVSRLILLVLAGVTLSIHYRSRSEAILTPGGRPGKRRPEADAPGFFDDAGVVSSLAGGV